MRVKQEKIPTAESFADKYKFLEKWDDGINWENIYKYANDYKNLYLKAIRYEYDQYQFFLDGYRNGSASISEVTNAHDEFTKLLDYDPK